MRNHPARRCPTVRRWWLSCLIIGSLIGVSPIAVALELEDEGAEVETLQQQLQSVGMYDGPITGFYGELTQTAVEAFQREQGLTVDGIAGTATQAALQALISAAAADGSSSLTEGDRGPRVAELQTLLRSAGYYSGSISGIFGPQTLAAVEAFQAAQGLAVDGLAGSQTLAALQSTPVPMGGTEDPNLIKAGESSDRVAALQERLSVLGYYSGSADGIFGEQTASAVREFQAASGLAVDGVAGPATQTAIGDAVLAMARSGGGSAAPIADPVAAAPAVEPVPIAPPPSSTSSMGSQPALEAMVTVPSSPSIPMLNSQPAVPIMPTLPNGMPPITAAPTPEFPAATPPGVAAPAEEAVPVEYSVLQLQRRLQELDLYQGSLDGQAGAQTNQAIEAAQDEYGVSPADFANP